MKKILITGGGGAGAESLWRSLSEKYELYFADADIDAIDYKIPLSKRVKIPFANAPDFIQSIQSICTEKSIDIIVPCVDEELLQLAQARSELPRLLLPDAQFVSLMLDKYKCMQSLSENDLPAPNFGPVEKASQIGFPLIVKPRSGRGSRGVEIIKSEKELEAYKILNNVSPEALLAQELKVGEEYTVLVAGNGRGDLKAIVPIKINLKKGITIRASIDNNADVISYCKKFHEVYKPYGVYNVQCILTDSGGVYPFEVNPRVSTTFCMSIAAGFDPFDDGFEKDGEFYAKNDVKLQRNWHNTIT